LPEKPFLEIEGKPILWHLLHRIRKTKLPIVLAVPKSQYVQYFDFINKHRITNVDLFTGYDDDPLARMYWAAYKYGFEKVIRITHDKIFVEDAAIYSAMAESEDSDYFYFKNAQPGTSFEIISFNALGKAKVKFQKVEHISYAIKAVAEEKFIDLGEQNMPRLLIDYPEDVDMLTKLFACIGNKADLVYVNQFLKDNTWLSKINKMPLLTLYTCCFNNENTIGETLCSVNHIKNFIRKRMDSIEYLLIDDYSKDNSTFIMSKESSLRKREPWTNENKTINYKYIRNSKNIGLSASSNKALASARGKYILRIDADDYFVNSSGETLKKMIDIMNRSNIDIMYPNNFFGSMNKTQKGNKCHHVGGTLFRTSALRHLQFTEGLRHHDSYDVFTRAKDILKIEYYKEPLFFYRQSANSMSKSEPKERARIKKEIESRNDSCQDVTQHSP